MQNFADKMRRFILKDENWLKLIGKQGYIDWYPDDAEDEANFLKWISQSAAGLNYKKIDNFYHLSLKIKL